MSTLSTQFEAEKNRKALIYTVAICGAMLLIALLVSWKSPVVLPHPEMDLIEINLGNDIEGFGEEQPLIKGEKAPTTESSESLQPTQAQNQNAEDFKTDDNTDPESAPVTKPIKTTTKVVTPPTAVITPKPKPQVPKIAGYNGPKGGTGNGATEDNGYKYQGNNPGGKGDNGSPNGNPDSYGNTPGGKVGGPKVTSGNRKVIRYYSFTAELKKATIYAQIKVSPAGLGSFIRIVKPSTSFEQGYSDAISGYLRNMQFDKADDESIVTVQFNFTVN